MAPDDPLEDIYAEEYPYDRQRLVDVAGRFVQVDKDSGDPVRQPAFHDLDAEAQVVALLLYRRIAVELGELDEEMKAAMPTWLSDHSDIDERAVRNYPSDLSFIEELDHERVYYIPEHAIEAALDYLELYG